MLLMIVESGMGGFLGGAGGPGLLGWLCTQKNVWARQLHAGRYTALEPIADPISAPLPVAENPGNFRWPAKADD